MKKSSIEIARQTAEYLDNGGTIKNVDRDNMVVSETSVDNSPISQEALAGASPTLKVVDFDFSVLDGFAWILLDDGHSVQCCLGECEEGYAMEILVKDCGHDWGICGDVNAFPFKKYGEKACMDALFAAAEGWVEII